MSLKSRLSKLQGQAGQPPAFVPVVTGAGDGELQRRLARLHRTRIQDHTPAPTRATTLNTLRKQLGGELIADGLIRITDALPLEGHYGRMALRTLRQGYRLPIETENDCRRVYIDTETTGLSGGSGTVAFLVGIAVVTDSAIELTQLLLTQFSAEPAMLSALTELLTPDDQLVSYNGKCFDLPLLITRYRMQGLAEPFERLPHLDLLHPVRRVFGHRWPDCRLISLEQRLLGVTRRDDIPGALVPQAWARFMQWGDADQLIRVVKHNHQDIVSLTVAHAALALAVRDPDTHDLDIHALSRWLAEANEAEAVTLLNNHIDSLCDLGRRLLAELHRRNARWDAAVHLWVELAEQGCMESIECLAKYHEHVSKNLTAAWHYCQRLPCNSHHEQRRRRVQAKMQRLDSDPEKS